MAREFSGNSSGDRLVGGDIYDSLSFLIVSVWFTASDLTLGSSTDDDIWGLVIKGASAAGGATSYDWALFTDMRTGVDTLNFNVSTGSSHVGIAITSLTSKISVDTWYNVVCAWDGSNHNIWLSTGDTANQPSPVATMGNTSYELAIGGRGDGAATRCWKGDIAEVAVYTSGSYPTEAEVADLHTHSPLLARTNGLASYWPIIGNTSPEIDMESGQNLTVTVSPVVAPHPPIIYPARASATPYTLGGLISI